MSKTLRWFVHRAPLAEPDFAALSSAVQAAFDESVQIVMLQDLSALLGAGHLGIVIEAEDPAAWALLTAAGFTVVDGDTVLRTESPEGD